MSTVDLTGTPEGLGDFIVNARNAVSSGARTILLPHKLRRYAPLLDGVCAVEIKVDSPDGTFPKLMPHELDECSAFKNPICLKRYCAPAWAHLRQINQARWIPIVRRLLRDGYTVLDFGISRDFKSLPINSERYVPEVDLPLRAVAARLKKSGVYIGIDTGEMHLAFQVDCQMWVVRPDETQDYAYGDWEYKSDRVRYFNANTPLETLYDSFSAARSRTA